MTAYYNENDPYAAQFLRNLIAAGHIAHGVVDERDLREIEAFELQQYTQCHFFAGVGIWSRALRDAGWRDDEPIWTGSCPCQPFSNAGQQKGFTDERHLWPYWKELIVECRPSVVVGEQVASALDWLDLVSTEMEAADYAFGASDLCAAGFGGSHIRQRLYFVGLSDAVQSGRAERRTIAGNGSPSSSSTGGLADDDGGRQQRPSGRSTTQEFGITERGGVGGLGDCESFGRIGRKDNSDEGRRECSPGQASEIGGLADDNKQNTSGRGICGQRESRDESLRPARKRPARLGSDNRVAGHSDICDPGEIDPRWLNVDWLLCRNPTGEPSWRPVESGTFPLAHAAPARVGRLRAYGNALDRETAAEFCAVVREIINGI